MPCTLFSKVTVLQVFVEMHVDALIIDLRVRQVVTPIHGNYCFASPNKLVALHYCFIRYVILISPRFAKFFL